MEIIITWHNDQFNVELASHAGAEPFLSIKGCRIANGSKGEFVSWPATKNQGTGKWWNHVWASDKFADVVLSKAAESAPSRRPPPSRQRDDDPPPRAARPASRDDRDAPF